MAAHPEVARYQFVVRRSGHTDELVARIEFERSDEALAQRVQHRAQPAGGLVTEIPRPAV